MYTCTSKALNSSLMVLINTGTESVQHLVMILNN